MIVLEYKDKTIYQHLKHFHAHKIGEKIALFCNDLIDTYFFNRMEIYEWKLKNIYGYIMNKIDYNNVNNFYRGFKLFKYIVFNFSENEEINADNFLTILHFCKEYDIIIYLINNNIIDEEIINKYNIILIEGSVNSIE